MHGVKWLGFKPLHDMQVSKETQKKFSAESQKRLILFQVLVAESITLF